MTDVLQEPADAAAAAAGVTIRSLDTLPELDAACALFERIWQTGEFGPPVPADLLRAMSKAGSYVHGAFADDTMVGACVGFFGAPGRGSLHSHITGVLPQRRGVGYALKLHQRAWTLAHGAHEISWTFDPLIRRNAYFNLGKLAADAAEYLPNFYGRIDDAINAADDTDRLLARWHLRADRVVAACNGQPRVPGRTAEVALGITAAGRPQPGNGGGRLVRVAVPPDIEKLRTTDPAAAADWRAAVREVLGGLLADRARIRGFDRTGWYIVEREAAL
ncbi:GNAT family N-acetyltransferase [Kribbella sp.]|uniref:GNAT family N-acetyltransferase n=1 Tax=Kribbella sp. TaxID=1871183 RepID=UPI002D3C2791|nr:GNAT family N-acetyltransferase [Kribbella sp.]HZX07118.1 GNAT family N-acetyltransferase [Kribbella sp.]